MNEDAEMAKRNRMRAAKLQTTAAGLNDAEAAKKLLRKAAEFEEIAEDYEAAALSRNVRRA